jgi:transposase
MAWLAGVELTGSAELRLQHLYRALDVLALQFPELEKAYLGGLGKLFEVDTSLCLLDTTSVYFDGDGPEGLAEYGYSRDKRPDLRQLVLGVMASRDGMPVGHVVLPGGTVDVEALVREVEVLRQRLPVGRPVLVFDRGMVSEERLRELSEDGWRYIAAARLRTKLARAALAGRGRYRFVAQNLRVKEVQVTGGLPGERWVVCWNPLRAERDRQERQKIVAKLQEMAGSGEGVPGKLLRSVAARRFLRITGGTVELDERRVKEDARYDGKWVLRTNTALPPQDVAEQYKNLWRIERAFRTLKSPLEIHPLYHWTERRVRAHVAVCVLGYGMLRVVERLVEKAGLGISGQEALARLAQVTVEEATVGGLKLRVRPDLTPDQERIFEALRTPPPPRVEPLVATSAAPSS